MPEDNLIKKCILYFFVIFNYSNAMKQPVGSLGNNNGYPKKYFNVFYDTAYYIIM